MEDEIVAMISNERTNISHRCCRRRQRDENSSSYPKFKGVVKLPNGCGWDATIFANHNRNWLGIFEKNKEAVMAYDSASIKLRRRESRRNFPSTELTVHESTFQDIYSTEAILNMINDGSYESKFMDFYMNLTKNNASTSQRQPSEEAGAWHHELFHNELTTNDVGKYIKLEIPKENAMRYFSLVPEVSTEGAEDDNKVKTTMDLSFLDKQLQLWNFQYCYQRSSQSFVFMKGWDSFVEDKGLKANDIISISRVDY